MAELTDDLIKLHAEVTQFLAEYCATLDEERFHDWVEYFVDDGLYTIINHTNSTTTGLMLMAEAGREALKERAAYLDGYFHFTRKKTTRLVTNTRVSRDEEAIVANSKFMLVRTDRSGRTALHVAGAFNDRIVDQGEGLRFAAHNIVVDADVLPSDFTDLL